MLPRANPLANNNALYGRESQVQSEQHHSRQPVALPLQTLHVCSLKSPACPDRVVVGGKVTSDHLALLGNPSSSIHLRIVIFLGYHPDPSITPSFVDGPRLSLQTRIMV